MSQNEPSPRPRSTLATSHGDAEGPNELSENLQPVVDADRYDPHPGYALNIQSGAGAPGFNQARIHRLTIPDNAVVRIDIRILVQSYRWIYNRSGALNMITPFAPNPGVFALGPYSDQGRAIMESGVTNTDSNLEWFILTSIRHWSLPPLQGPGFWFLQDGADDVNAIGMMWWEVIHRPPL